MAIISGRNSIIVNEILLFDFFWIFGFLTDSNRKSPLSPLWLLLSSDSTTVLFFLSQQSKSFESITTSIQLDRILKTRQNQEKVLKTSSWNQEIFSPEEKSKSQETPGWIGRFDSPVLQWLPILYFL